MSSDTIWTVVALYCVFCGFAMAATFIGWVIEHRRGFWPWFRRWNPVYLRAEVGYLARFLEDDRNLFTDDAANTAIEQAYRTLRLIQGGHIDPSSEASRYSVKGGTLHVNATETSP